MIPAKPTRTDGGGNPAGAVPEPEQQRIPLCICAVCGQGGSVRGCRVQTSFVFQTAAFMEHVENGEPIEVCVPCMQRLHWRHAGRGENFQYDREAMRADVLEGLRRGTRGVAEMMDRKAGGLCDSFSSQTADASVLRYAVCDEQGVRFEHRIHWGLVERFAGWLLAHVRRREDPLAVLDDVAVDLNMRGHGEQAVRVQDAVNRLRARR